MLLYYNENMDIVKQEISSTTLLNVRTENTIKKYLPEKTSLTPLVNLFAALADEARLQIVSALSISDMCVTDISSVLGVNQTTLSHQLKTLRDARLVSCQKQGKTVFYALSKKTVDDLMLVATHLT